MSEKTSDLPGAATVSSPRPEAWLEGDGSEMGRRIRQFDWSTTSLGPIARWPATLRSAVSLCVRSRFPMHIWWGPELIGLYNDAYAGILGKRHPFALGRPAKELWAEVWDVLGPQVDAVWRGESTYNERRHMVVTRNGFPEDTWFTWSQSPIFDETGKVMGVHGVALEESSTVLAEKSREMLSDEHLAKAADERARSVLESIPEAFFSLDRDWKFTYMNPQCFVLLGKPPGDLLGKSLWDEYPGLYGSPFEPIYRGVAETRKSSSIVSYFPDHKRWYDVRAYPSQDGGLAVYFRDVSQQKETETALAHADEERERLLVSERTARGEAERAGRVKDEFLATLSHELRTPLNAIVGWCEILLRTGIAHTSDTMEALKTIERNAQAQAQIIADILDMSSIMAGKVRIDVQPVDLANVVRSAVETVRPAAEAKGVKLEATFGSSDIALAGDPNRLQQVFWNLLSNAVKFTPRGGQIAVELDRVESHLEVKVKDSGKGITTDFLPHVFDRFRQADSSTTRQHGGLGLGLSIVKQLVELHGGTVSAQSEGAGKGTLFVVTLPVRALESEAELPRGPRSAAGGSGTRSTLPRDELAGIRVLVVDDEPDARALVKRLLEDYGAKVTAAGSVPEAFAHFQANVPDVVVSDIGMPGEDGYSFVKRIRALAPNKGGSVPALALTAYARPEDHGRSLLAGFQMHISKPVNPSELVTKVKILASEVAG